jgi:hypothetical protein
MLQNLLLIILLSIAPSSAPASPQPQSENMLCTPVTVHTKDELQIDLPQNHGGDMAIVSPSGEYFFLAFASEDPASKVTPIIPSATFKEMKRVQLKVSEAKGISWSEESPAPKGIFTKTGVYRILVSDALETEDPVLDGWCNIRFEMDE